MPGSSDPLAGLKPRARVELVNERGEVVADERLMYILMLIEEEGSLLRASRRLGVAYSRAWDAVARAERLLGARLIEAKRGGRRGGGARLTETGRRLLQRLIDAYALVHGAPPRPPPPAGEETGGRVFVYAGSHDPLLEAALGAVREETGLAVEAYWLGSARGLAALLLGEADAAGSHLYSPGRGYNRAALEALGADTEVETIASYERLLVIASRTGFNEEEAARGLLEGRLVLASRPPGSGTRLRLLHWLRGWARRLGLPAERAMQIPGLRDKVYSTHTAAAEAVARGEADVALVAESAAERAGLRYTPLCWEKFEILALQARIGRPHTVLREALERLLARGVQGYRRP